MVARSHGSAYTANFYANQNWNQHIDLEHPVQTSVPQNPKPAPTGTTKHCNPDAPNSLQQQRTCSGFCIKPPQRHILVLGGVV